jgi:heme/copper-type cytochrome/quinol oxidase subunit 2
VARAGDATINEVSTRRDRRLQGAKPCMPARPEVKSAIAAADHPDRRAFHLREAYNPSVRALVLTLALLSVAAGHQDQGATEKPFAVTLRKYAFAPARIEVRQDDLVKIELHSEDIAHSFTIDAYRVAKRVDSGHPVTIEFRADRAGTFPFYCNLQIDDGCRKMRGELVITPRP